MQFVSDRQFAFAAGVAGMIYREKAAATFFLGEFFAESLIFAESANTVGAIQVAGTTQTTQTPFFIAACDYVLIGDEYYAASAYLSRAPVLVGSLIGQDWCKIAVASLILLGFGLNSYQRTQSTAFAYRGEEWVPLDQPRNLLLDETFFSRLFNPKSPADIKVERPMETPEPTESATGAGQ